MSKILSLKSKFLLSSLLVLVVAISYREIFFGFFQQDEWLSFSFRFLMQQGSFFETLLSILTPSVGHYQPLNTLVIQGLFTLFGINYLPYSIVSIFLHSMIVILVFYLSDYILKNLKLAFCTALLFALSASSYQATSWVMADLGIHFSTIFALISIYFFLRFIDLRQNKSFIYSLIFLLISLLFKEITLSLFLVLPLSVIIFAKEDFKSYKNYIIVFLLTGFAYMAFRIGMIFLPEAYSTDTVVTESQPLPYLAYNLLTFPIKGFVQAIIPQELLIQLSYFVANFLPVNITGIRSTPDFDNFVQEKVLESIYFIVFFIISGIGIFALKSKKVLNKQLIFSMVFILLATPIFALAPERVGRIFIIDSRNLYFVVFGSSLFLVSLIRSLTKNTALFVLMVTILIISNFIILSATLHENTKSATTRRYILEKIKDENQSLPNKTIFFTESDSSFYGLPATQRILPFQSGFGQTLLVWYQSHERFPNEFFKNKFLWEIKDQGYAEFGGRGFGYFRDFSSLARLLQDKKLPPESVIAFRYDSGQGSVQDITKEVWGRLEGYRAGKSAVDRVGLIVSASNNSQDAWMAIDGDRKSAWDSKLTYNRPQYFEIDLSKAVTIAQITIDTYNNVNQNQVGFAVSLSSDGKTWKKVFYAKRYPPDEKGYIDIYFKPQLVRFIKIEQKGSHAYANWVIHDLKIYEKNN